MTPPKYAHGSRRVKTPGLFFRNSTIFFVFRAPYMFCLVDGYLKKSLTLVLKKQFDATDDNRC